MRALVVLLLLSTTVVGCTLLASLQEHRSSVDADPTFDAAVLLDGEIDASLDAPIDTLVDEGLPTVTRGCAERDSSFCDDFDDGGALTNWTSLPGVGTVAIVDAGLSRPNAVAVSVPSVQPGGRETAKFNRTFTTGSRRVRLAVNVRNVPDKAEVTLLAINLGGGKFVGLRAIGRTSGVILRLDIEGLSSTELAPIVTRTAWHDIGLELVFPDAGAGTVFTHIDSVRGTFTLPVTPSLFIVELGLLVSEAAGSTVAIDDVTVD